MKHKKVLLLIGCICITLIVFTVYNKDSKQVLHIGFGGDTMLGRLVNTTISHYGYSYIWGNIRPLLHETDLNLVNLETTITSSTHKVPKTFNFKADPDTIRALQAGNIHAVNIANNHILDFGIQGLNETIELLDKAGINHVGAGINIRKAKQPSIVQVKGIRIGIIGYSDHPSDWQASNSNPGINYVKIGDIETVKKDIALMLPYVDLCIVSIHWGPNWQQRPSQEFRDFAHAMIDAGVAILHGHSAHIFQGIEHYKNGIILYNTGDFVDDYAIDATLRNDWALFYELEVIKDVKKTTITQLKVVPLIIENMQVNKAEGDVYSKILSKIRLLSSEFNTEIDDQGVLLLN